MSKDKLTYIEIHTEKGDIAGAVLINSSNTLAEALEQGLRFSNSLNPGRLYCNVRQLSCEEPQYLGDDFTLVQSVEDCEPEHVTRAELYSSVEKLLEPQTSAKVISSIDEAIPEEYFGNEFPWADAYMFLFNGYLQQQRNSIKLPDKSEIPVTAVNQ